MNTEDVNPENDTLVMFPASKKFQAEIQETSSEVESDEIDFDEMFPASKNFPLEDDLIAKMLDEGQEEIHEPGSDIKIDYDISIDDQIYSNDQLLDRINVNLSKLNELTNKMKYYMDEIDIFLVK